MKIKFIDKRTTEFKNGEFHAVNDGEPIQVDDGLGADLIATGHFEQAFDDPKPTKAALMKLEKDDLIAAAVGRGLDLVPDNLNKKDIVQLILDSYAADDSSQGEIDNGDSA
jgi:hypothetical protein